MFKGDENHKISFEDAGALTKKYRLVNPGEPLGGFFGRDSIEQILNQAGCVGIRYYYGLDNLGQKVMVLVGVDEDENDLVDVTDGNVCKELSYICPPRCSTPNVLNS